MSDTETEIEPVQTAETGAELARISDNMKAEPAQSNDGTGNTPNFDAVKIGLESIQVAREVALSKATPAASRLMAARLLLEVAGWVGPGARGRTREVRESHDSAGSEDWTTHSTTSKWLNQLATSHRCVSNSSRNRLLGCVAAFATSNKTRRAPSRMR